MYSTIIPIEKIDAIKNIKSLICQEETITHINYHFMIRFKKIKRKLKKEP